MIDSHQRIEQTGGIQRGREHANEIAVEGGERGEAEVSEDNQPHQSEQVNQSQARSSIACKTSISIRPCHIEALWQPDWRGHES